MAPTLIERLSEWIIEHCVKPCAVAGFFVLVAFLWTLYFQHAIAYPFPFLFLGAVMGSAWFGGILSGFLAIGMSTVLIDYFLVPPLYSMAVAQKSQTFVAAFIVCAIAIALVSSAQRRSEKAIRDARDQLENRVHERTAELRRSNQELEESGRRLRMWADAIPQPMWSAQAHGSLDYCNQHLIDSIPCPMEGALDDALACVLHPVDERLFREAWRAALAAEKKFEVEARVLGADGEYRWFLIRSIPQHSADGRLMRWFGIHIDIEQQYRERQGLIEAHDELSRSARTLSMGEMAASIAHELNQPLTAVVTHAYACREWLSMQPANLEKAAATADKIVQESTRAGSVVSRVRALFRTEAPVRLPTDLNRLIVDLVHLQHDEAARRNVAINLLLADDLPAVELDPIQVQQVLLNLINNGMDAMTNTGNPSELTIRSQKHGQNEVRVTVEDSGAGLAAPARIFEPFFTTKPHGMGMGLAICRSIVESHDGRIWATPRDSGGAAFHFTLRVHA